MEDIVIEELSLKAYKIVIAGVSLLISSIVLLLLGRYKHNIMLLIVGIIGTLFFGVSSLLGLLRIMKNKPLLIITLDGIVDSSSANAVGFIGFDIIESIEIVNIFGQKVIGITPKNVQTYIKSLTKGKQRAASMNVKMNYPPISIRVDTAKDMTIEDIYTMVEKRLTDYKSLYY